MWKPFVTDAFDAGNSTKASASFFRLILLAACGLCGFWESLSPGVLAVGWLQSASPMCVRLRN